MPLQLAHLSDIHLDGDPQKDSGVHLRFLNALEHAVSDAPDFLLLVGDLFESNRVSEACIDWAMTTLESQPCPVVMIPGNHDCLDAEAIFKRFDFNQIQNVVMLSNPDGQVHLDADRDVAFWGRGMVDHIPEFHPLANVPERPQGTRWYVALGHGIYVGDERSAYRSSPVHAEDIAASGADYVALGHHHAALEVHANATQAAYSGSPTDDIGRGATYAWVTLNEEFGVSTEIRCID